MLSASVVAALKFFKKDDTKETEKFVELFDKFLIALTSVAVLKEISAGNLIWNPTEVPQTKDSKYLLPSTFLSYTYFFLQWLKDEFLGYLYEWRENVKNREGFSALEKQK